MSRPPACGMRWQPSKELHVTTARGVPCTVQVDARACGPVDGGAGGQLERAARLLGATAGAPRRRPTPRRGWTRRATRRRPRSRARWPRCARWPGRTCGRPASCTARFGRTRRCWLAALRCAWQRSARARSWDLSCVGAGAVHTMPRWIDTVRAVFACLLKFSLQRCYSLHR